MALVAQRNFLEWWWRYGGPRDFWISQRVVVGALIKKEKLQPLDRVHFVFDDPVPVSLAMASEGIAVHEAAARIKWPRPFPGGLRIPHLHFEDDVFELNQEQWGRFTASVVTSFRKRLEQPGSVSFHALIRLADGMAGL